MCDAGVAAGTMNEAAACLATSQIRDMADKYDQYTKDELLRLLRERDRRPRFGLTWERDLIDHDRSVNSDFVALDLVPELSQGTPP